MLDKYRFASTVTGVCPRSTRATLATGVIAVAREITANADLVTDANILDLVAYGLVVGNQVIVGNLVHIERIPRLLVSGLKVTGEYSVPELDLVQQLAGRSVTPDDADIHHVEMIVGSKVHPTVAVVVTERHDHAGQVVLVFGLDFVVHSVEEGLEGSGPCGLLQRLGQHFRLKFDVSRQVVAIPERHEQPEKAGRNDDIADFHAFFA